MKKTFKVVMLPTQKATNLFLNTETNELFNPKDLSINNKCIPQHLYILSDEEIKEGNWFLNGMKKLSKAIKETFVGDWFKKTSKTCNKIVATTDQLETTDEEFHNTFKQAIHKIPESFIKAFIKDYNEGNPIAEVDLEVLISTSGSNNKELKENESFFLKTRPDNTVIVYQSKMYSREQVEKLCIKAYKDGFYLDSIHGKYDSQNQNLPIDKWIQDNI